MSKQPQKRDPFKVYRIPINKLTVPENTQREFKPSHAKALAAKLDLDMIGLPVVNHADGKFWLVDGQHRVAAVRERFDDTVELDCEVHENLTPEGMAKLFLGRDNRRAIVAFEKFKIATVAGYERERAIQRVIEAMQFKIVRHKAEKCISCVTSLCKVYDRDPSKESGVAWSVRVARDGFAGDPLAFDGSIIEAFGRLHVRYNGRTPKQGVVIEQRLVAALSEQKSVRTLMKRAEAVRDRTGNEKSQCLAAVCVDIYNAKCPKRERLADWWSVIPDAPEEPTPKLRKSVTVTSSASHAVAP